jgi:Arc/MetJ-type ribon-helix-helix transcriptional regulator
MHLGMSKRIMVRLPDDLAQFVDAMVRSGDGESRTAVITRALERERRRQVAARDAELLAAQSAPDVLERLAAYARLLPCDVD